MTLVQVKTKSLFAPLQDGMSIWEKNLGAHNFPPYFFDDMLPPAYSWAHPPVVMTHLLLRSVAPQ